MRIAAEAADLVAANAIRGGALVVAGGASENIASGLLPVKAAGVRIRSHPARRMRILGTQANGADSARDVASVAALRGVAALAPHRLRLGFDRVPNHEVAAMDETTFDLLRHSRLHRQSLRNVVAVVALRLRVAGLAELLFLARELAVLVGEVLIVLQKRLRQRAFEIGLNVTRRAQPLLPLGRVFVTRETFDHRREGRLARFDYPRVTGHTLPVDSLHLQVKVVLEMNLAGRPRRIGGENRANRVSVGTMAIRAKVRLRQLVSPIPLGYRVAAVAAQAIRLARFATIELGEVHPVRKARRTFVHAGSEGRGQGHA